MIERERQAFSLLIGTVKEVVYSKPVRLIDVFRSVNGLQHWPDDDVWVDDNKVEHWLCGGEEIPGDLLGEFFGDVVDVYDIVVGDGVFGCDLLGVRRRI